MLQLRNVSQCLMCPTLVLWFYECVVHNATMQCRVDSCWIHPCKQSHVMQTHSQWTLPHNHHLVWQRRLNTWALQWVSSGFSPETDIPTSNVLFAWLAARYLKNAANPDPILDPILCTKLGIRVGININEPDCG